MIQPQELNLTEQDFDMIIEGLDSLPEKGMVGEFAGDLLGAMLFKDDKELAAKHELEREQKRRKKEAQQREMKEDIKILQGKLLMLKRYLQEQSAIRETTNIIKHIK